MTCHSCAVFLVILLCIHFPGYAATDEACHMNSTHIRELLLSSYQEGLKFVEDAAKRQSANSSHSSAAAHGFKFARKVQPATLKVSRAAEVFHKSLELLEDKAKQRHKRDFGTDNLFSSENVELLAKMARCILPPHPTVCEGSLIDKFRTVTGICNNKENPLFGAANTPLLRFLPADYEDGQRVPRGFTRGRLVNGVPLPSVRRVSRDIARTSCKFRDNLYTQALVEWGQYLDHDISLTPSSVGQTDPCFFTCDNTLPCFPIEAVDIRGEPSCMPFRRSVLACFSFGLDKKQNTQRQQVNSITSFLDASVVYGSCPELAASLRDLRGQQGKLRVNCLFRDVQGGSFLPFVPETPSVCRSPTSDVDCFLAGDSRVSEGLPLASMHTLWVREHNRIAEALGALNKHWSPEMIFQTTRKIVGALHQIITIRDYLPKILGPDSFDRFVGPYRGYDSTVNPGARNVFSTAAMRFGHGTITPFTMRLDKNYRENEHYPHLRITEAFFSPFRVVREGGLDPIVRGFIGTEALAVSPDMLVTEAVTDSLVVPGQPGQMDLPALNLQRGRDHGLAGYNDWRAFCGLSRVKTLEDFREIVGDYRVAEEIFKVYKNPDNIDVWLGGLVEDLLPGARVGPLFACLLGKQFKALRDGDRFWFQSEGVFTKLQLSELLKTSLSRVICDNTGITEVPADSFLFQRYPSGFVSCHTLPSVDLEAFREEKGKALEECGQPKKIRNGDFVLHSSSGKQVALYSCFHGFKLEGPDTAVCEDRCWSDPPRCTGKRN